MLVPSATDGYLDAKGNWTPFFSDLPDDLQAWHTCRTSAQIETRYAQSPPPSYQPFIGVPVYQSPDVGEAYKSMTGRIRQPMLTDTQDPNISWEDIINFTSHTPVTVLQFVEHVGRFPLHPSVNWWLIMRWLLNDECRSIEDYLTSLSWPAEVYLNVLKKRTLYLRFFVLTRGYDFPLTVEETQLLDFYSPDMSSLSRLVASTLLVPQVDYSQALVLAQDLRSSDDQTVASKLNTPYIQWVDYTPEYLSFYGKEVQQADNLLCFTDNQILSLQLDFNLEFSPLTNFPSRRAWVAEIENLLRTSKVPHQLLPPVDILVSR